MKIKKNLLIICEGESTEPNYFNDLRDEIIEKGIDYTITILPKPPLQKEAEELANPTTIRTGGRRRTVRNVQVDESYMVEDMYRAQPTRYVREAQLGLIDGTYDEAWAVYDFDGHPDHEAAYKLAQKIVHERKVHLGFSSISFETWVLWHFEQNTRAFQKTQCRTGRDLHDCGQGSHTKDCAGDTCVTGYLKIKGYIPAQENVKAMRFKDLKGFVHDALKNAYFVRQKFHQNLGLLPAYEFNPYTTVDRLIFKLMQLPVDYLWVDSPAELFVPDLAVSIKHNYPIIEINLKNISETTKIVHPDAITLVTVEGQSADIMSKWIPAPQGTKKIQIDLSSFAANPPFYIAFKVAELTYKIFELPILS